MYRGGCYYDAVAKTVIQIYLDYSIKRFPIDEKSVCRAMAISLVPYSAYPVEERNLLKKKSMSGFYCPPTKQSLPMIFYNDNLEDVGSYGNMRRNIFHEVYHYINGDTSEIPYNDDLADYFGKYFLAPIPYLIAKNILNENEIIAEFGVDFKMASYIVKNLRNRMNRYGTQIFDYEKPLLRHLL